LYFTIRHFRNGTPVGVPDRSTTMYEARSSARLRQGALQSHLAVILADTARGEQTEIEVIDFARQRH